MIGNMLKKYFNKKIKIQYFQGPNGAEFALVDDAVFFEVLLMEIRG
jgi:hypothetical protein